MLIIFQAELSDWVKVNEEELRAVQAERRGNIQVETDIYTTSKYDKVI